jgi:uncharacterized caspase-like protein
MDRSVLPAPRAAYRQDVDRWAVIVGISRYQHERLNLTYAHRDAEALYQVLLSPVGGGFEPGHIRKLIDEEATTANIVRALRGFLKRPARDDIVLLFFACHGAPDPDRPANVYLITYDSDPNDIAGTALPMREVDAALRDSVLAQRVVLLADTCHSGSIAPGGRRAAADAAVVNSYLQRLSEAQAGLALLTSAEAGEVSREDKQWGGGHGVFTHYLLEGMRGAADVAPRDGVVTAGELFEYVRARVQAATGDQQHPWIGSDFDRDLPLAVTASLAAEEHHRLGSLLYEWGWLLDDPRRFAAAAEQFAQARRLAPTIYPEAELHLGQARLAGGRAQEAVTALTRAVAHAAGATLVEAWFTLGLAYAALSQRADAAAALERSLAVAVAGERAAWVGDYITWLRGAQPSAKFALLIGVNTYRAEAQGLFSLQGCVNDVALMREVLIDRYGFPEPNVTILTDADATYRRIGDALAALRERVTPYCTVVIYFSGHALSDDNDVYLLVHDSVIEAPDAWENAVRADDLHRLVEAIPTKYTTLILDTHPNTRFLARAEREASYSLMIATENEVAYETTVERHGEPFTTGAFTYALVEQLTTVDAHAATYRQLMGPVINRIQAQFPRQMPRFYGIRDRTLFAQADDYLDAYVFSMRRTVEALSLDDLRHRADQYRDRITAPFPQLHRAFGRAFCANGSYREAVQALRTALEQQGDDGETLALLAIALVGDEHDAEALTMLQRAAALPSAGPLAPMEELQARVERLVARRKRAVLVGIDAYANVPGPRGAGNDVAALKRVLLQRCGFREEDIQELRDQAATRREILRAFDALAAGDPDEPALFYFAGNGSTRPSGELTLVSVDGRGPDVYDIGLDELATRAAGHRNLVTVIDARWTHGSEAVVGSRVVARDPRPLPAVRPTIEPREGATARLAGMRRNLAASLQIGRITLYPTSIVDVTAPTEDRAEARAGRSWRGVWTRRLVRHLAAADPAQLTYTQLAATTRGEAVGDGVDWPVFSHTGLRRAILASAPQRGQGGLGEAISLLRRLSQQRGVYPEGHLHLGIAYFLQEDFPRAIEALEQAVAQLPDDQSLEASSYLGRALLASGRDLGRAVSELNRVTEREPDNVPAYYFLGQALRALVERENLARAEQALRTYLDRGAPLGHEAEIIAFLAERDGRVT